MVWESSERDGCLFLTALTILILWTESVSDGLSLLSAVFLESFFFRGDDRPGSFIATSL